MKKLILIASALLLSGAAQANDQHFFVNGGEVASMVASQKTAILPEWNYR